MTKEEKIKEAYGEYWEIIKNYVDESGWCCIYKKDQFAELEGYDKDNSNEINWRPKSLKWIENNNGWIKIESENDLPKIGTYDMSKFKLMYWTNAGQYEANDYKKWVLHYSHLEITHYQFIPIIKLNEPLY